MTRSDRNNWRWWRTEVLEELGISTREGRPYALDGLRCVLIREELARLNRGIDNMARYLARLYKTSFSTIKRAWLGNREARHTCPCL